MQNARQFRPLFVEERNRIDSELEAACQRRQLLKEQKLFEQGFWGDKFVPYTLFDDDKAVASVGVSISELEWNGHIGRYAQLSTVMTEPAYRGRG